MYIKSSILKCGHIPNICTVVADIQAPEEKTPQKPAWWSALGEKSIGTRDCPGTAD